MPGEASRSRCARRSSRVSHGVRSTSRRMYGRSPGSVGPVAPTKAQATALARSSWARAWSLQHRHGRRLARGRREGRLVRGRAADNAQGHCPAGGRGGVGSLLGVRSERGVLYFKTNPEGGSVFVVADSREDADAAYAERLTTAGMSADWLGHAHERLLVDLGGVRFLAQERPKVAGVVQ
jgi:hypothetical protein